MPEKSDLLCFHCGQAITDPPRIHELPGGGSCPGCVERVLDSLPPILPAEIAEETEARDEAGELQEGYALRSGWEPEPPPEPA